MKPKFTVTERKRLLKRILIDNEPIARVAREAGISRTFLYRWLARYKEEVGFRNLRQGPSRAQTLTRAVTPKKGVVGRRPHHAVVVRIRAIEEVLSQDKQVSQVCRELNISKPIFYRWLKNYIRGGWTKASVGPKEDQSLALLKKLKRERAFDESAALAALEDKRPLITRYARQTPHEYEELILNAVRLYPELSSHKLVHVLPTVGNRPVVGHHGVQNVLRRQNLRTYAQRRAYADSQRRTPFISISGLSAILSGLSYLVKLPSQTRSRYLAFISAFFIPLGLSVALKGIVGYLTLLVSAPSLLVSTGYIFATVALTFGLLFFLYSSKYYLTIALVLAFSRHSLGRSRAEISLDSSAHRTGLIPDVSSVTLTREPFVSIHLPLYNEKRVVNRLLEAVTSLDYDHYEVIVVDDSTDETKEIVADWKAHPRLKVIHRESRAGYKGGALGEALKVMDPRAEFVIIFDADFLPYPDTITQFLKYLKSLKVLKDKGDLLDTSSRVAALQGYQWHVLNKSENWITRGVRSEYAGSYVIERTGAEIYGGLKQIAGSVYMIRADILKKYSWGTSITEDFELTLRLYRDGYRVVYTPYIQTPSECVATIKRLVRQRMRWAEGHSHNIRKHFGQLLFGRWTEMPPTSDMRQMTNDQFLISKQVPNSTMDMRHSDIGVSLGQLGVRSIRNSQKTRIGKLWIPSKLSLAEKLEFLYLSPYYLQSFFFLLGTFFWFLSEAVFQVRLPFWTEVWGWSLVLTNLLSLPLMNLVGLFLEESEEKDYLGIASFVALTHIVAPFQAYAAVKGFLAREEGPWFRTPKTGKITDVFRRGHFYRWLTGILGTPAPVTTQSVVPAYSFASSTRRSRESFNVSRRKAARWLGNLVFTFLIVTTCAMVAVSPLIPLTTHQASAQEDQVIVYNGQPPPQEEIDSQVMIPFADAQAIFHTEPRVRYKLDGMEVEITTLSVDNLETGKGKGAYRTRSEVVYPDAFVGAELRYRVGSTRVSEALVLPTYAPVDFIEQRIRTTGLAILQSEGEIVLAPLSGGQPVFAFTRPYMYEQGNPSRKSEALQYTLEKKGNDYILKKELTAEGRAWLADPKRVFPVVIDPTIDRSNVLAASAGAGPDTAFGSNQRKIAYMPNATGGAAWYAFHGDDTSANRVRYKKCAVSTACDADADWSANVNVDVDGDAGDGNPSVWVEGDTLWIAWIDFSGAGTSACCDTTETLQFRSLNTTNDTFGQECSTLGQGTLTLDNYAYIAAGDNGDLVVGFSSTTGDTEADIFEWATGTTCTAEGDGLSSIQTGSGLPAGGAANTMRPVALGLGNKIHVVYDDATDEIRHSIRDVSTTCCTWDSADNIADNGAVLNDIFSVTTDGSSLWLLYSDTATTTVLQTCASSCTGTWTNLTSPWTSGLTTADFPNLTYFSGTVELRACINDGATGTTQDVVCKDSPAGTISWGTQFSIGFTTADMANLSTVLSVTTTKAHEFGLVVRAAGDATLRFATVPEKLWFLLGLAPWLPAAVQKWRRRRQKEQYTNKSTLLSGANDDSG